MLAIVTGATGFIGGHLVAALSRAPDVEMICVGRQSAAHGNFVHADLSEEGWSKKLPDKADLVFHLAQSSRYRDFPAGARDVCAVNVGATVELADWARRAGVRRFLFASSGNVYGDTPSPVDETASTNAQTMYAASKLSAEILLRPFSGSFEIVIARLFGIYGPGQKGALFPNIIERVNRGGQITLASGVGVRINPLYVDDCIQLLLLLSRIKFPSNYEVFNVGGTQAVTLREMVQVIESIVGRAAHVIETTERPTSLVGAVGKLASHADLGRLVPLRQGLSETIAATGSDRE